MEFGANVVGEKYNVSEITISVPYPDDVNRP